MKKRKNQAGSTKGVAAAAKEKATYIKNRGKQINGVYYYHTPISVRQSCKVLYLVNFHQFPLVGKGKRFPEEQYVEFVDSNPLIARRNAFEFVKSEFVFPEEQSTQNPNLATPLTQDINKRKFPCSIYRYCTIECVPFGQAQGTLVYIENNSNPTPAFLEGLEKELEFFKNLGLGDIVKTTEVIDEEGTPHSIIAEGNEFAEIKKAS